MITCELVIWKKLVNNQNINKKVVFIVLIYTRNVRRPLLGRQWPLTRRTVSGSGRVRMYLRETRYGNLRANLLRETRNSRLELHSYILHWEPENCEINLIVAFFLPFYFVKDFVVYNCNLHKCSGRFYRNSSVTNKRILSVNY